ncbi:class-II fumarase/aspartase family protein [Ferrimonas lipolytica]|uniref:Adenylosuccinate lyase family protein n=1 Tax=Ferrimonas lipolytica TaxID=2724191 RepID=A0A6H1UGX5_9GAMM|nr:adenylosuccinate lyase family protein [Ferrimonas lipolytica]QIZ77573.1 adenylosuccinate lyase family protein [Ferrimonas lipolytica]
MKKTLIATSIALLSTLSVIAPAQATGVDSANATNVSVYDSAIYGDLFSTPEIRNVFSDTALVNYWLQVEIALAQSQAELGIIPVSAAEAITAAATIDNIDMAALQQQTNKVGRGIKGVVGQVKKAGGSEVANYLHLGTTTQDIMDSATVMQVQAAIDATQVRLRGLILQLADLAEEHQATIMIARSNGQDAIPTTFGLHLTTYIGELHRHSVRLDEVAGRLELQFGSTVGTLAPFGDQGLVLQQKIANKLQLQTPLTPWNPSRDTFAETVQTLALVNATLGRVAIDVNTLSRTQINELKEGEGGASSTMPHKRNPRASEFMGGLARLGAMYNSAAPQIMSHNDARQGAPWIVEWSIIPESFMATNASLERAQRMFSKLIVNKQVMLDNFADSNNFVMSEAVMNAMVDKVGRADAYSLVKKAIKNADKGSDLAEVLRTDPQLSQHFDAKAISAILAPENYLGQSEQIIERAVAAVRKHHQ